MTFFERFTAYNREQNLFKKNDNLLLAVSGGVDSVILCELCKQANYHFKIAHCNFQLRGDESERDEKFVRALAKKYEVAIFVKRFNTKEYAAHNKVSIQVAARELRYEWFADLMKEELCKGDKSSDSKDTSSTFLLTAHHANDNIETLLMNFFKGTGIKGLQGILPRYGKIIRPLLFARKEEILLFASENNLSFVEDSSNSSDKYTRNYFRHQLIPSLQKKFPQVEENLLNNIDRYREIEILYAQSVSLQKKKLLEVKGNEIHIPVLKLLKTEPLKTIIYEIIKEYGFTARQTEEVASLLKSESGKYISSATYKIIKNRGWLIISPVNTFEAHHILIYENDKEIDFEEGKLKIKDFELSMEKIEASHLFATLDADTITFPLLLRKWKQGDYFYPLGMHHKKKLSKFFIDQKLSVADKEKIWVLESNKKIIWIVGKRIDDRFKITEKTKRIFSIELRH